MAVSGARSGSAALRRLLGAAGIAVAASMILTTQPADASTHQLARTAQSSHRQDCPGQAKHDQAKHDQAKHDQAKHDKAKRDRAKHHSEHARNEHAKDRHATSKHEADRQRAAKQAAKRAAEQRAAAQTAAAQAEQAGQHTGRASAPVGLTDAQRQAIAQAAGVTATKAQPAGTAGKAVNVLSNRSVLLTSAVTATGNAVLANGNAAMSGNSGTSGQTQKSPSAGSPAKVTPSEKTAAPKAQRAQNQMDTSATAVLAIPTRIAEIGLSVGAGPGILLGFVLVFGMGLVVAGTRRRISSRKG